MTFASGNIAASQRDILGLPVYDLGWAEALAFAEEMASLPFGQSVIAFLDARNGNRMMSDREYRAVLERQIVLPEGDGIDIASKMFHGRRFPANLSGTTFVPALLTYLARPMRVALVGGEQAMLMQAAEELRRHTPWHEILPIADGAFDRAQSDAVMERVRAAKADILLVSMGSPAQETWIDRHVGPGHARLVLSVAGLFEAIADGTYRKAAAVRASRLERLRRFARQPDLAAPVFLYHVLRHKLSSVTASRGPARTAKAGSL
ncbi:WecB/TagA/CpsF family glycosyltransferase [Shinella sp. NM-101]|uniref:WecB/TagA/CpsF family glycosyltransferase n=1 Tax=Shinella sp. NM-101 TaxID=2744455 RepID=UPI00092A17F7|nr:WecB/TagA/CpsF family glycosyltransferase [Shinella sp. NM-101]MBN9056097.1 WecB/TagA/CpsF family glycosyltransferase [Hyphomicrobiales bacterium]OJV03709.1 MAG: glycosyltransferase [Shinella sp. 65-6]